MGEILEAFLLKYRRGRTLLEGLECGYKGNLARKGAKCLFQSGASHGSVCFLFSMGIWGPCIMYIPGRWFPLQDDVVFLIVFGVLGFFLLISS